MTCPHHHHHHLATLVTTLAPNITNKLHQGLLMAEKSLSINLTVADLATDFVAGLLGGSAGLIVGHPFDTIKILLQTSKSSIQVLPCCGMILKQEGAKGFFKGMAYPLASVGFLNSIFFGFNMIADSKIVGSSTNRYCDIAIAGGIAGAIQAIPATPVELVKVKLQTQLDCTGTVHNRKPRYNGPWDCLCKTFRAHGIRGCYRGITTTVIRDVSGFSVYMTAYKFLCDMATAEYGVCPSMCVMLLAGGLAGVVSWMVNFPVDTVKSILQSDNLRNPVYRSSWHCFLCVTQDKGFRVLWKGFTPAIFRAFPLNAVTLCTYDWTQQRMKLSLKRSDV